MKLSKTMLLSTTLLALTVSASNLSKDDYLDNATITAAVKLKQTKDKLLSPLKVKVKTANHKTSLIGTVNSETQYMRLLDLVSSTRGVEKIDTTKLKLQKQISETEDKVIQYWAKVRIHQHNKLGEKEKIPSDDLLIEARNRSLYVTGLVSNYQQKKALINVLSTVPNTKNLVTDINIDA
jgi:osmotically-inducible protein OsmY